MSNKLSLSVILPIKSSKAKNFDEYFKNAIDSIKNQQVELEELLIVHTSEESLIELLNNYDFGNLTVTKLLWDKDPNYCDQVNYGIKNAKGKWVSLFEFDDEYASIWFKNVKKYTEAYPEVQMFLPVVVEVDDPACVVEFRCFLESREIVPDGVVESKRGTFTVDAAVARAAVGLPSVLAGSWILIQYRASV
jgi:glycosyltransferase involved in cell wall biosynthesis